MSHFDFPLFIRLRNIITTNTFVVFNPLYRQAHWKDRNDVVIIEILN